MLRNFKVRISLLYILIGCTWILTTDRMAFYLFKNPKTIEHISNYKGWLFVILSGLLIYYLSSREISRRNKIENELLKAKLKAEENDKLKSEFLANMSHEIRTPMNAIMGFTELLEDPDYSQEQRIRFQSIIRQRSKDLLNIINDILDISKLNAGQLKLIVTNGDLSLLIKEISDFFELKNALEKKDINLIIKNELKADQCIISTDLGRLKQILINLLSNAYKFTNEGSIEIACSVKNGNTLEFYIKDTGVGIPKDKLDLIFERFHQVKNTNLNNNLPGTGLGLSISQGLVNLFKGKIWVESEVDVGSTFYISIPYQQAEKAVENQRKEKYNFDWKGKTILVVEDDINNMDLFTRVFAGCNVKMIFANDGKSTLEVINQNKIIDLILMDICLPDIDGYELTKQIHEIKKDIKVIAQTAFANRIDKETCELNGCIDYISKPIKRIDLLKLIDKHLMN